MTIPMINTHNLQNLLEQERFRWVKEDLLPLFGLLDFVEDEGNGWFSLPRSKENLIRNLNRITGKRESIIEGELEEFEESFSDYIEVKEGTYEYYTRYGHYSHPPSRNPCPDPKTSTVYYILKPELADFSRNALNDLDFDQDEIFKVVISKVHTVEDLIYLYTLKLATERCKSQNYYQLPEYLKEILEDITIDMEIIDNNIFKLEYEEKQRYLPMEQRCLAIFYSHSFNSSSCGRINNILIKEEISQFMYDKLEEIPIVKIVERSYNEIKQRITSDEERLPLFEYKDYRFKFMSKYRQKLLNGKLYEFEIDGEHGDALEYLKEKGMIEVEGDKIILSSYDKYKALYDHLEEKEYSRIDKNKRELLTRLLRSGVNLEQSVTGTIDTILKPTWDENQTEAFNLISDFEKKFREFIITRLENRHGQNWWEQGIKGDIKKKCQERLHKDSNNKNQQADIHNYMDFMDLYSLIEWKQNKDIFQPYFPKDLTKLKTKLDELSDIRNAVMHSKWEITENDLHKIKIYTDDIRQWIDNPSKRIDEQKVKPPIENEDKRHSKDILVGFECGTGEEVRIRPAHLFISGLTQKSGKTTTLEALVQRSGLSIISFITKPDEKCFDTGEHHKPFFQEKAEWKVVEKLFEAQLGEKMKDVRPKLIELCKREATLIAVKERIDNALEKSKGTEKKSLILLQAYFEDLFNALKNKEYTNILCLKKGINLMDLTEYNEELQSYIINSVLNEILHKHNNAVVIIPEAWKFIPQSKRTPCKYSIEQLIRQGATQNNFLWFDSQDIAGVDKTILKNVSIWILGLQTEINEVKHTIEQIPLPKNQKPTNDEIMSLQLGEFIVCNDGVVRKTYVMPKWMNQNGAMNVARSRRPLNRVD
jgi:hypothetical protein